METTQHPELDLNPTISADAREALRLFVAELQLGLDERSADTYNRHFAGDVLWGSPYGMALRGYAPLHAIHEKLLAEGRGGRSRYEVEQVVVPAPDVVIAQVRRTALDNNGANVVDSTATQGAFSEMALYVLVKRGHTWWLAAGQNTLIADNPNERAT